MTDSNAKAKRPVVGVTMGDPSGIGPEVIVRALSDGSVMESIRAVVIGDKSVISVACESMDTAPTVVDHNQENPPETGAIEVIDLANCRVPIEIGKVSEASGKAAGEYIEKGFELWKTGKIDALCTAPINKESLNLGGYDFPGHTEFFAALAGVDKFAMSFFADKLRVVLLSTHLPLVEAVKSVKRESVAELISFTDATLSKLLEQRVSIAVAGLNPHASENGKFGT